MSTYMWNQHTVEFSARYHCNARCTGKHDEMHFCATHFTSVTSQKNQPVTFQIDEKKLDKSCVPVFVVNILK